MLRPIPISFALDRVKKFYHFFWLHIHILLLYGSKELFWIFKLKLWPCLAWYCGIYYQITVIYFEHPAFPKPKEREREFQSYSYYLLRGAISDRTLSSCISIVNPNDLNILPHLFPIYCFCYPVMDLLLVQLLHYSWNIEQMYCSL